MIIFLYALIGIILAISLATISFFEDIHIPSDEDDLKWFLCIFIIIWPLFLGFLLLDAFGNAMLWVVKHITNIIRKRKAHGN